MYNSSFDSDVFSNTIHVWLSAGFLFSDRCSASPRWDSKLTLLIIGLRTSSQLYTRIVYLLSWSICLTVELDLKT